MEVVVKELTISNTVTMGVKLIYIQRVWLEATERQNMWGCCMQSVRLAALSMLPHGPH